MYPEWIQHSTRAYIKNVYLCPTKFQVMEKDNVYSESMQQLRTIVAEMERADTDVDVLFEKVKEAGRLIGVCRDRLFRIDGEVRKVLEELT